LPEGGVFIVPVLVEPGVGPEGASGGGETLRWGEDPDPG